MKNQLKRMENGEIWGKDGNAVYLGYLAFIFQQEKPKQFKKNPVEIGEGVWVVQL